jgi:predicted nucleic acid-binding protein
MDAVLLDTDVFSFFFKGDSRREAYAPLVQGKRLCLSFMSVAELLRWSLAHKWGEARRQSLDESIRRTVVLPYDAAMAESWARIAVHRSRSGRPISCSDCWIAASALRHGLTLLTHNRRDFEGVEGLRVLAIDR